MSHERFGPNATRTGEAATVTKDGKIFSESAPRRRLEGRRHPLGHDAVVAELTF